MESTTPVGATVREYTLISSNASSMESALGQLWTEIAFNLSPEGRTSPSLTVLLFPNVPALSTVEGMRGFNSIILQCRDCCGQFGRQLRSQSLHPEFEDRPFRSPCPAVTLSSRVGPMMRLDSVAPQALLDDDLGGALGGASEAAEPLAVDTLTDVTLASANPFADASADMAADASSDAAEPEVATARRALESLMSAPDASKALLVSDEEVLEATMAWFAQYFSRVFRIIGPRQRRVVLPSTGGTEQARRKGARAKPSARERPRVRSRAVRAA